VHTRAERVWDGLCAVDCAVDGLGRVSGIVALGASNRARLAQRERRAVAELLMGAERDAAGQRCTEDI
jgi:hypothetical protein